MKSILVAIGCLFALLSAQGQLYAHIGGGIAVGPDGNIYCVHTKKSQVLRVSPAGNITILASGITGEGDNRVTRFQLPHHLSMAKDGTIYVAGDSGDGLWQIKLNGDAAYFWPPKYNWQTLRVGALGDPFALGPDNNIYSVNHPTTEGPNKAAAPQHAQILKTSMSMRLEVLAGGDRGHADGMRDQAKFGDLFRATLKFGPKGDLYVSERYSVRIVTPQGKVSTLAGSATTGLADDRGKSARFGDITCIAVSNSRDVFVTDAGNRLIRKIDVDGNVTTIAGNGKKQFKDGGAADASFFRPVGIAIDAAGNLYFMDGIDGDPWGFRIRKLDTAGMVSTLAIVPG